MTKSLKNMKNEKCTLKDLDYGASSKWVFRMEEGRLE